MNALTVARRFVASYFNKGDVVLYGKYKNHHGRIVGFGEDKWGNPTIEIEPVPKGRKQNKIMGLFKIWRADVKEKAMAELAKQELAKQAANRVRPDMNLKDVRKLKQELFASLSPTEIDVLKIAANPATDMMGRPGDETIVIVSGPNKKRKYENHSLGKEATKLLRSGWLRFSEGPENGGLGWYHLTTASENALRAFSEGSSPLLEKQAMSLTKRIVARYVKVAGLERGRTVEVGSLRIHRFAELFKIWDLTNAGKRGKKVDVLTIQTTYKFKGESEKWMDSMSMALVEQSSMADVKRLLKDLEGQFPGEIDSNDSQERGIDVNPGGTTTVQIETNTGLVIRAEPLEFRIVHRVEHTGPKGNKFFQDTSYWSRSKKDAAPFYNWLKANLGEANRMDINDFRKLWSDMNLSYDSH